MKKIVVLLMIISLGIFSGTPVFAFSNQGGRIFLQVEKNGEAWYIYPGNGLRYYLGRPNDALDIMRNLGLGAKHEFIIKTDIFPKRLSGMILLDVEASGEAYYINPGDLKKYYLGRPRDAFGIMSKLGIGITNNNLLNIKTGDSKEKIGEKNSSENVLLDVFFTPQAPFGEWSDIRQQDGCEESSALMAVYWARGEMLTLEKALVEIKASSDYQNEKYGEYRDISIEDTLNRIVKGYLGFYNASIKKDVFKNDLIIELKKGNVLIVPVNGRLLDNPYYTQPGPPRHMLVVRGYNSERNVFITNDPGTRHGEAYEYDVDRFYYAMRDYVTGFHEDILEINKSMIVVEKE